MDTTSAIPLVEVLYAAGVKLKERAMIVEAAAAFRALVVAAPRDERGWLGLAECHVDRDEDWVGLELLGVAWLVADRKARISVLRARLLRRLGRYREASVALGEAMRRADGDDEIDAAIRQEGAWS